MDGERMDQETKDILLMLVDGFKDMRADIKEMKADITTMKSDIADLQKEQASMKADIATIKSDIADLQKEQASMREDITALKVGVHEVQAISQALRHQQEVMNAKLDNLTLTTASVESVKKLRTDVGEHLQQMGREIAAG